MKSLKKSFIAGIMMVAALIMVIPTSGNAEIMRSKPKVTDEDVALTVRVGPGYRYRRGGYYYGPYRYNYYGYPRYYYSPSYRGYYYPGYRGYYHPRGGGVYFRWRGGW